MRNINLLFKKNFKGVVLLKKIHIHFTLEPILNMVNEKNKGDVESLCERVTKHT